MKKGTDETERQHAVLSGSMPRGNMISRTLNRLRNKVELAKQSADRELFWQSIARQVTPATVEELPEYVQIDRKLMARCIIVQ